MSNYNSTHTGAELDEAIGRVIDGGSIKVQVDTNTTDIADLKGRMTTADARLTDIESVVGGEIDLSALTPINAFDSNGSWFVNNYYKMVVIDAVPSAKYHVKANANYQARVSVVKTAFTASGDPVDYATGEHYILVGAGNSKDFIIGDDAVYIYIAVLSGSGHDCTPSEFSCGGTFSALQERVSTLEAEVADLQGGETQIDLSAYTQAQIWINESNVYWAHNAYLAKLIPCEQNGTYRISNTDGTEKVRFCFLQNDTITYGSTPPYAEGYTNVHQIAIGAEETVIAPADAHFLWVSYQSGNGHPSEPTAIYHITYSTTDLSVMVEEQTERVDELDAKVDSVYAKNVSVIERMFPNSLLPCVSFQFDDIPDSDDAVIDLFDELGTFCNFAFMASDANIASKGQKYLALNKRGYGICSHSVDGTIFNLDNYTRSTALAALQSSKNKLEGLGMTINGFVAPSSQMANEFLDLVQMTYGYAFTSNDGYSGKRVGNPCRQTRQTMQSKSLDYCKGRIDNAITYGYNITFYGHSANFGTTYEDLWNIAKVRALVEYAMQKRDQGLVYVGNSDDCMKYFYGNDVNNIHISGDCGTITPKDRHHYYLHNVTSATIQRMSVAVNCDMVIETDASYTSGGITFGSGYKFNSAPNIGAGEIWLFRIMQNYVIATKVS